MKVKPREGATTISIKDIKIPAFRRTQDLGDLTGLIDSIKFNGLITPIVVDKDLNLIDGYRRIKALSHLKIEKIDARFYDDLSEFARQRIRVESEMQKKRLSWQEETELKSILHKLYTKEFGHVKREQRKPKPWGQKQTAQVLGIAKSTMSEDLKLAAALQHFPELKKIPSKRDALRKMYRLRSFELLQEKARRARLRGETKFQNIEFIHGDCLQLIKDVQDDSIDLVITDPPWGIDLKKKRGPRSIEYTQFEDKAEKVDLYKEISGELWRVMKPGSHLYIFFGIEFYKEIYTILDRVGFDVREVPCIWIKEGGTYTNWEHKPMPQYESFFFAVKTVDGYAKQLKEVTTDVFTYPRARGAERIHPTEKPIELMKRLIALSSAKDEIVFDPFAGSASALIAAAILERRAVGFELNRDFYDEASNRLSAFVSEQEIKETEGTEEV